MFITTIFVLESTTMKVDLLDKEHKYNLLVDKA